MISEFLQSYGSPIAWLVAALGWGISNHHANLREKRKEFRAEIDTIEKVLKDLVAKLALYFKAPERDEAAKSLELEIKVLFRELDLKWDRVSRRQTGGTLGLYVDPCALQLEKLFDLATGQYFETVDRIPSTDIAAHTQDIYIHALLFTESLHTLFLMKFDKIKKNS